MKYRGFRVGVAYASREYAKEWLEDFKTTIDRSAIKRIIVNGYTPFMIELRDGTIIEAFDYKKPNGMKFNQLFVDPMISDGNIAGLKAYLVTNMLLD